MSSTSLARNSAKAPASEAHILIQKVKPGKVRLRITPTRINAIAPPTLFSLKRQTGKYFPEKEARGSPTEKNRMANAATGAGKSATRNR